MAAVDRVIREAKRRLLLQDCLNEWGRGLVAGAGGMLLMVLVEWLLMVDLPWWGYGVVMLMVVGWGVYQGWTHLKDDLEVATEFDRRFESNDVLGTYVHFRKAGETHEFAKMIGAQAKILAEEVCVREKFKIEFSGLWGWVVCGYVGVLIVGMSLAALDLDLWGSKAAQLKKQREAERRVEIRQRIEHAELLVSQAANERKGDEVSVLSQVQKTLMKLSSREVEGGHKQDEVILRLSDVARKLHEEQKEIREPLMWLGSSLSQLDLEKHGPANEFARALRSGDYQLASDELKRISQYLDEGMIEGERSDLLKEQFQNLSGQMNEIADQAKNLGGEEAEDIARGMSDSLDYLAMNLHEKSENDAGGSLEQAAWSMAEQLRNVEQRQMQLEQLENAEGQVENAMQHLARFAEGGRGEMQKYGKTVAVEGADEVDEGEAVGERGGMGMAINNEKLRTEDRLSKQMSKRFEVCDASEELSMEQGGMISQWGMSEGRDAKLILTKEGEQQFLEAVLASKRAIENERVSRRHETATRRYFQNLQGNFSLDHRTKKK